MDYSNFDISRPIRRFLKLIALDRREIYYIYIFAIFSGILNLTFPVGVQAIVNFIGGGQFASSWVILVLIVIGGTILVGVLKLFQVILIEILQQRLFARSALEFAYRIPRIKLEALLDKYPPELMNRFFDTLTLQKGLSKILLDTSSALLELLFGLILISLYHPIFIVFSFTLCVLLLIIFYFTIPMGLRTSLKESSYKYEVAQWLEELARTVTTFKQAHSSQLPLTQTDKMVTGYIKARRSHFRVLMIQTLSSILFKVAAVGALLILGSYLVVENQINIGQFVAAEITMIMITASVEKFLMGMDTIYDVLTATEKIGSVLDLPLDNATGIHLDYSSEQASKGISIVVNNLSYSYKNNNKPSIQNIAFQVKSGQKVCICGDNGAGKTTIVNILSGYFRNYAGEISFDNVPLQNLSLESIHKYISEISGLEDLFNGTLYENIAVGLPDVSFADVTEAVQIVGLMPFVQAHPDGYYRPIYPEGRTLPQSIIHKIIIARSIARKPRLLLLNNNLSDIDLNEKEALINYFIQSPHLTFVAATNDIYIARNCETIILLEKGKVIAQGTFDEIIATPYGKKIFCI
jgi:ABC-type bacteriocin/lantibiotic exporter with double-glycine peptidase domain